MATFRLTQVIGQKIFYIKKPKQAKPLSKIPNKHENMHMGNTVFSFGPLQYKEDVSKIV